MARTVLIVDDHAPFRATVRRMLESEGYDVVGEAPDGEAGIRLAAELDPDLVLLDIRLPDGNGFTFAPRIARNGGGPAIVLVSSQDLSEFGDEIASSPAVGFVPKGELSGEALELRARLTAIGARPSRCARCG